MEELERELKDLNEELELVNIIDSYDPTKKATTKVETAINNIKKEMTRLKNLNAIINFE